MIKPVCRLATCVILFAGLKVRRQKAGEVGCSWSAKQADKLPDDKTRISRDSSHLAGEERAKRKKGITSALFTEDVRQKCLATCLISRLLQNVCTQLSKKINFFNRNLIRNRSRSEASSSEIPLSERPCFTEEPKVETRWLQATEQRCQGISFRLRSLEMAATYRVLERQSINGLPYSTYRYSRN